MDISKFLKEKDWYCLGKWKEPIFLAANVTQATVNPNFGSAIPFAPSAYLNLNYRQHSPALEYKKNIAETKKLFEKDAFKTFTRLKKDIELHNAELNNFSAKKLDVEIIRKYISMVAHQSRQWYEIMLVDGALSILYPASLPKNFILNKEKYNPQSLLAKVALPKKLFPMIEKHRHLLEMTIDFKKGASINDKLCEHVERYSWMGSLCWWDEPFDEEHYREEAEQLAAKNPEIELKENIKKRKIRYSIAEELLALLKKQYPLAYQYVDMIRELTDLKEENWDAVSMAGVRMRPLFKRVANEYYLSYNQLMQLSPQEMVQLFKTKKLPVEVNILNNRLRYFLIVSRRNLPLAVVTGDEVKKMEPFIQKETPALETLKGMSVWPGMVRGRVHVLLLADNVGAMQEGEVLVCPMSDPDYMPAIKKATAIITDQGGLLCHASIVARELQIPCVVGTEYATKILKDGDLVEVDASKGVVRILRNNRRGVNLSIPKIRAN